MELSNANKEIGKLRVNLNVAENRIHMLQAENGQRTPEKKDVGIALINTEEVKVGGQLNHFNNISEPKTAPLIPLSKYNQNKHKNTKGYQDNDLKV